MNKEKDSMSQLIEALSSDDRMSLNDENYHELIYKLKEECEITFDEDLDLNSFRSYQPTLIGYLKKLNTMRNIFSKNFIELLTNKDDSIYEKNSFNNLILNLETVEVVSILLRNRLKDV